MRFRVVLIALAFVAACSTTDESGDTTTSTSTTTIPGGGDAPTVVVVPAPPVPDTEPAPEPAPEPDPEPEADEEPDIEVRVPPCDTWVPPAIAPGMEDEYTIDQRCEGILAYWSVILNDETVCPTGHPCPDYSNQVFYLWADDEWLVVAGGDNISCAHPVNASMADACAQLGLAG